MSQWQSQDSSSHLIPKPGLLHAVSCTGSHRAGQGERGPFFKESFLPGWPCQHQEWLHSWHSGPDILEHHAQEGQQQEKHQEVPDSMDMCPNLQVCASPAWLSPAMGGCLTPDLTSTAYLASGTGYPLLFKPQRGWIMSRVSFWPPAAQSVAPRPAAGQPRAGSISDSTGTPAALGVRPVLGRDDSDVHSSWELLAHPTTYTLSSIICTWPALLFLLWKPSLKWVLSHCISSPNNISLLTA